MKLLGESAVGRDQRLIFAMNSLLQEEDAATGKSVMSIRANGRRRPARRARWALLRTASATFQSSIPGRGL
jgi:hypothetical protein